MRRKTMSNDLFRQWILGKGNTPPEVASQSSGGILVAGYVVKKLDGIRSGVWYKRPKTLRGIHKGAR
jgi:hypothetical protein